MNGTFVHLAKLFSMIKNVSVLRNVTIELAAQRTLGKWWMRENGGLGAKLLGVLDPPSPDKW